MTRAEYRAYLRSPEWAAVRRLALRRHDGLCGLCGTRYAVHVHHRTYANVGAEGPEDVVAVCGPCHEVQHPEKGRFAGEGRRRRPQTLPSAPTPGRSRAERKRATRAIRGARERWTGEVVLEGTKVRAEKLRAERERAERLVAEGRAKRGLDPNGTQP